MNAYFVHEVRFMIRTCFRFALVGGLVALGSGCPDAASTPCIIQSPLLGGYTVRITLQGTPPAGCENVLPPVYGDIWKMDTFPGNSIVTHPISMPYADRGGDPDHNPLGTGTLSEEPDTQSYCYIPTLTEMRGDVDPLGLGPGQETYSIVASNLTFLDGAKYQGAQFEGDATITFGSCTGSYKILAVTPGQLFCATDIDCSPFGNPDAGIFIGSGMNPEFAVSCVTEPWVEFLPNPDPDATPGTCFLSNPFPSLAQ
jgi:hypothetical protein